MDVGEKRWTEKWNNQEFKIHREINEYLFISTMHIKQFATGSI